MASDTTPKDEGPIIRPFADWLREQAKGKTHEELSESLHDLLARVMDTGKKGTLILAISVERLKGSEDALLVADQIKLKLPEHDRESSIFYADKHGNLSRKDPNQLTFDSLREVPHDDTGAVVDIDTGEIKIKDVK